MKVIDVLKRKPTQIYLSFPELPKVTTELGREVEVIWKCSLLCLRSVYLSLFVPLHLFLYHLCMLVTKEEREEKKSWGEIKLDTSI